MEYEVELPDEPVDGLFRGRVYVVSQLRQSAASPRRELIASFTAPTWRHVQDEVRAIRAAHAHSSTYRFDDDDELVRR